jgi:hypothetical protein
MNLDFLKVLSQPEQKHREQVGTAGTGCIHAGPSVPSAVPASGNSGNKIPVTTAGTETGPHLFPVCSQGFGREGPNVYAAVPPVPGVPNENVQVCNAETDGPADSKTARSQVSRWLDARCAKSQHAWGSEKSLNNDYRTWCQNYNRLPYSLELFRTILNEWFQRDAEGWQGLCLAVDFARSEGTGSKSTRRFRLATTIQ